MSRGWQPLGSPVEERDGRVFWRGEDWGPVVHNGDTLSCCGCEFRGGDTKGNAKICECHCHALYRQIHFLPSVAVSQE